MLRVPRHESRDADVLVIETSNHPPNKTKTHNPELLYLSSKFFTFIDYYEKVWIIWVENQSK